MYFKCSDCELDYLKSKDRRLGAVIDRIGVLRRPVNPDLFSALVYCVVGQQISGRAQQAIMNRLIDGCPEMTPAAISALSIDRFRDFGISARKAEYILGIGRMFRSGELDPKRLRQMSDAEVIQTLTRLKGIGVWTAEMVLLFSLRRPDVLSFGDLGIHRGMRMVYRHRAISREQFEKYRRRLSPCGSAASLYFWEVAGGAIPELTDPAPKQK